MKLLQSFLFTFSLILLLSLLCYGQVKVRKIEKRSTKNEPIELVSAEVGDLPFNNENQVLADKSWLKNLKLNVKNISGKTIVYMKVNLEISAQGKCNIPYYCLWYLGIYHRLILHHQILIYQISKS